MKNACAGCLPSFSLADKRRRRIGHDVDDGDDVDDVANGLTTSLSAKRHKTSRNCTSGSSAAALAWRREDEEKTLLEMNQLPHLVRLYADFGSSCPTKPHLLPPGKTCIGTSQAPIHQDIIIDGGKGVEDQHAYIVNRGQSVTLHPYGELTFVDRVKVILPVRLINGSVLCFGQSNYFRFYNPREEKDHVAPGSSRSFGVNADAGEKLRVATTGEDFQQLTNHRCSELTNHSGSFPLRSTCTASHNTNDSFSSRVVSNSIFNSSSQGVDISPVPNRDVVSGSAQSNPPIPHPSSNFPPAGRQFYPTPSDTVRSKVSLTSTGTPAQRIVPLFNTSSSRNKVPERTVRSTGNSDSTDQTIGPFPSPAKKHIAHRKLKVEAYVFGLLDSNHSPDPVVADAALSKPSSVGLFPAVSLEPKLTENRSVYTGEPLDISKSSSGENESESDSWSGAASTSSFSSNSLSIEGGGGTTHVTRSRAGNFNRPDVVPSQNVFPRTASSIPLRTTGAAYRGGHISGQFRQKRHDTQQRDNLADIKAAILASACAKLERGVSGLNVDTSPQTPATISTSGKKPVSPELNTSGLTEKLVDTNTCVHERKFHSPTKTWYEKWPEADDVANEGLDIGVTLDAILSSRTHTNSDNNSSDSGHADRAESCLILKELGAVVRNEDVVDFVHDTLRSGSNNEEPEYFEDILSKNLQDLHLEKEAICSLKNELGTPQRLNDCDNFNAAKEIHAPVSAVEKLLDAKTVIENSTDRRPLLDDIVKAPQQSPDFSNSDAASCEQSTIPRADNLKDNNGSDTVSTNKPPIGKPSDKPLKVDRRLTKSDPLGNSVKPPGFTLFRSLFGNTVQSCVSVSSESPWSSQSPSPSSLTSPRLDFVRQLSDSPTLYRKYPPTSSSTVGCFSSTPRISRTPSPTDCDKGNSIFFNERGANLQPFSKTGRIAVPLRNRAVDLSGSASRTLARRSLQLPGNCPVKSNISLNRSLRPNLENFKGEKLFGKDTVTTNLVVSNVDHSIESNSVLQRKSFDCGSVPGSGNFHDYSSVNLGFDTSDEPGNNPLESKSETDFGYISDSGVLLDKPESKFGQFSSLRQTKGPRKCVTFAKDSTDSGVSISYASPPIDQRMNMNENKGNANESSDGGGRIVKTYLEMVEPSSSLKIPLRTDAVNSGLSSSATVPVSRSRGLEDNHFSRRDDNSDTSSGDVLRNSSQHREEFNNNLAVNGNGCPGNNSVVSNSAANANGSTFSNSLGDRKETRPPDPDYQDLDDLDGGSRREFKNLYEQHKAERLHEQEMAEQEKRRLEEIMKLCSELEIGSSSPTDPALSSVGSSGGSLSRSSDSGRCSLGKIKTNGSLTKLALSDGTGTLAENSHGTLSSSSNSEDDLDNGTIKRRPFGVSSPPVTSNTSAGQSRNVVSDASATSTAASPCEKTSPSSVVRDDTRTAAGGLDNFPDFCDAYLDADWSASLEDRIKSEERKNPPFNFVSTSNGSNRSEGDWLEVSRNFHRSPPTSFSSAAYFSETRNDRFGNGGVKLWRSQNQLSDVEAEMELLRDHQQDVIQTITAVKQKISDIEERQAHALKELERERAMLDADRELQSQRLSSAREKIETLEQREQQLLAEATGQRAAELSRIEEERAVLADMERRYSELSRAEGAGSPEEGELSDVLDAVENQRFLVDNLEFQQLEGESRFEEEKETIQKQLKLDRADVLALCNEHQATLDRIASQQTDLLKQVDIVYELEKERQLTTEQLKMESEALLQIKNKIKELSHRLVGADRITVSPTRRCLQVVDDSQSLALLQSISDLESTSRQLSNTVSPRSDYRHRSLHNIEISNCIRMDEERRQMREIKLRASLPAHSPWGESPRRQGSEGREYRRVRGGRGGVEGDASIDDWSQFASEDSGGEDEEEEESSASGSDRLTEQLASKTEEELEQLYDMDCLLVLAKAERLRLVEEQAAGSVRDSRRDVRRDEQRCADLEQRLAVEIAKNNDNSVQQEIKKRNKERLQSRPLTRYLPVRDHNLDLTQFIQSSGHNIDHCQHIIMTSTSCRGYLMKMGARIRSWKRRWFVFDRVRRSLSYFASAKCDGVKSPRGVVYFQAIQDVFVDHLHQVKSPTPQLTFCVKTLDRTYYFVAPSPDSMRIWIDVIFTGAEGYHQFSV